MLGLLAIMVFNVRKLSGIVRENIGISVVINDDASDPEILSFQSQLDSTRFIKSSNYISKAEAAAQFKSEMGEDFVEFIGYNPLPPTIEIFLKEQFTFSDSINMVEQFLFEYKIVSKVYYQKSLVDLINKNVSRISFGMLIFCALLLIISITLIYNTIRLAVYSKRMLIKSMLLVGATQGFIRKPFIINGILQGLIGGLLSVGLLILTLLLIEQKLPELEIYLNRATMAAILGSVLVFGILITWSSNYFAVKKYLKLNSEDLY